MQPIPSGQDNNSRTRIRWFSWSQIIGARTLSAIHLASENERCEKSSNGPRRNASVMAEALRV